MRWRILNEIKTKKREERQQVLLQALFANRGLKTKKQQAFFLRPPLPEKLKLQDVGLNAGQMKKAVQRLKTAIKKKEKIIVYGDYDADGLCATAIVWEALRDQKAQAMPFVPQRKEGYGLKNKRLEEFKKSGVALVVTVDQGIVQNKQALFARKIGLDLIITDHHALAKKKPLALAAIHTIKLSGAGVAWFLAKALGSQPDLDLVTIGTITDVMPLLGPNRSLVKAGLKRLAKTRRPGLRALMGLTGIKQKELETYHVGFLIGPRLNAAGRLDDPMVSLRLLCTNSISQAQVLARQLEANNQARQVLERQTTLSARRLWLKEDGQSPLIFVYQKNWQRGVVGLTARSLVEEFYRPAVVLAPGKNYWVASARSVAEFNIIEAVRQAADLLGPHGGHAQAAGFSVKEEKLFLLKEKLIALATKKLGKKPLGRQLMIDFELGLSDLTLDFWQKLNQFAPFGKNNPQPVFASRRLTVMSLRTVGNGQKHLKMHLLDPQTGAALEAIGFGLGSLAAKLKAGRKVDVAFQLSCDQWHQQVKLQLKLKDVKTRT